MDRESFELRARPTAPRRCHGDDNLQLPVSPVPSHALKVHANDEASSQFSRETAKRASLSGGGGVASAVFHSPVAHRYYHPPDRRLAPSQVKRRRPQKASCPV